ncbi:MAG TPA: tetraacyldisaccharide 4'-kinase [Chlamydiales bacterium]|nr:tetraacyldisaccharide 4'-kinase [Chlamydiales bacterium]
MLHTLRSKLLLFGQEFIESGAAIVLAPVSWIWGLISICKNQLYDRGWLPVHRLRRTVVSVGNLVAGGTGKTPLVHLLAKTFAARKVAILSRGYGAIPDEPLLLSRRLPLVKVYVGKNRVASAKKAIAEGAELIILDDGFQHRGLARDFDFVILDGKDPFGKGHYLPWGFLRDSPRRLKEVDALFVQNGTFPGAIQMKTKVLRILDVREEEVASIRGWRVGLFCGIAKPDRFKKTVVDLGAEVVAQWILADHEPADLERLHAFCKGLDVRALVCTEKDFVKLPKGIAFPLPIFFLEMGMEIVAGQKEWEKLIEKIDQKIDNSRQS